MAAAKQTPRFFRIAQLIGIIGVSLLVLNFIYQIWRLHANDEVKTKSNICNLQVGSCTKQFMNNQTLTLSMTPLPIQFDNPSTVTVSLKGIKPEHVAVLVFPYPATTPASKPTLLKRQQDGTYTGMISITKTSSPKQKWVVMVVLQNGTQEISAPFQFEVMN